MIKKTITYVDFDGVTRTEDFYFNLTKAEITEMDLYYDGGLQGMVQKISTSKNITEILNVFKDIISKAYGEKSLDGKHFMKSQEINNSFTSTEAYSELLMECLSDPDAASTFINGMVPRDLENKSSIPAPAN